MEETKVCTKCKQEKPLSKFYRRFNYSKGIYGKTSHCDVCVITRTSAYRENHLEQARASSRKSATKSVNKLKDKVFSAYGNKCACCGETERQFLTLDHVNGGGTQHIKKYSVIHYRDAVKRNYPDDYRVLCFNCNCGRRNGVCPHQLKQNV